MDAVLITTAATATAGLGVAMAWLAMNRTLKLMVVAVRRNRRRD